MFLFFFSLCNYGRDKIFSAVITASELLLAGGGTISWRGIFMMGLMSAYIFTTGKTVVVGIIITLSQFYLSISF
jgi:hypothetical protein